jgi:hypothetical protein
LTSDYPDCDDKDEQFEEEKRRDEVEEYSDSKSCYQYGGVFPDGALEEQSSIPSLSVCQVFEKIHRCLLRLSSRLF